MTRVSGTLESAVDRSKAAYIRFLKIVVDDSRDSGHFDTVQLAGPDRVVGFYKKRAFNLRGQACYVGSCRHFKLRV
jgi:hypothetical protein